MEAWPRPIELDEGRPLKISGAMVGIAGVHLVAAELAVNGITGTVTSRNTQGIDLLASRVDGLKNVGIQVKTSTRGQWTWMLNEKAEELSSRDFFYVFVELNLKTRSPEFFVVPSAVVAKFVRTRYAAWIKKRGRNGRKRNRSGMRNFWIDSTREAKRYQDNWKALSLRERGRSS